MGKATVRFAVTDTESGYGSGSLLTGLSFSFTQADALDDARQYYGGTGLGLCDLEAARRADGGRSGGRYSNTKATLVTFWLAAVLVTSQIPGGNQRAHGLVRGVGRMLQVAAGTNSWWLADNATNRQVAPGAIAVAGTAESRSGRSTTWRSRSRGERAWQGPRIW
mgnify:CR=1 FL=1